MKTVRKCATWTNHEIRKLKEMHTVTRPSLAEMSAAFPRHPPDSVYEKAHELGLRERRKKQRFNQNSKAHWLGIAHLHFQKREAEIRAWGNGA